MGIAFFDRRALLAALFVLALIANAVQFVAAWLFSKPTSSDAMVQFFSGTSEKTFEALYFADQCLSQAKNVVGKSGAVFGGLNPVFFAEIAVLFLTFALVALVAFCPSRTPIRASDRILGFLVFLILLIADQARYFATSIEPSMFSFLGPRFTLGPKMFFTWSSYCFHGDIGWLFDVLGYIFMYGAVGLGVATMSAIVSQLRKDISGNDISKVSENYRFSTICRVYVWLPYFSYFGFAIWLSCTKIDGAASFAYAFQAILITTLLLLVFITCLQSIIFANQVFISSQRSRSNSRRVKVEDPTEEFLAPFGTKAVEIFLKIIVPPLTMIAIWSGVIQQFLKV